MSLDIEKVYVLIKGEQIPTSSSFSSLSDVINFAFSDTLADGTGLDQANIVWHVGARTLAANTEETWDLRGGVTDRFGTTLNFVKVKLICIKNNSATDVDLAFGGTFSNPFEGWTNDAGSSVLIKKGGCFFLFDPSAAGMGTTSGTADKININNTNIDDNATYDIIVIGTSA